MGYNDLPIFIAKEQLQPLVDNILTTFEGRDLNEPSYAVGMEVLRDTSKRTITITNRTMITELLSRLTCLTPSLTATGLNSRNVSNTTYFAYVCGSVCSC